MKLLTVAFVSLLILCFLFVQWANKPENVNALRERRRKESRQQIQHQKRQGEVTGETQEKKPHLRLTIDETFANNQLKSIEFHDPKISYFKFEKDAFNFSGMIMKGQIAQDYFLPSRQDFQDFVAEIQMGIWGENAHAGIFWAGRKYDEKHPNHYQAAYSSPTTLYLEDDDDQSFHLGGLIESENNQLLRVERFGKNLKVCVNGRVLIEKEIGPAEKGKLGIFIGHRGGNRPNVQSIAISIKSFRVWQ